MTVVHTDLKNILLCISAFFSVSTLCMQLSILATAVVFILEVSERFKLRFSLKLNNLYLDA
jgi:26S proteasome regulatory subunit N1